MKSYKNDSQLQDIIIGILVVANNCPEYSFTDGIIKFKERNVIIKEGELRRLVKIAHDSCIVAMLGFKIKWLKVVFHRLLMKK